MGVLVLDSQVEFLQPERPHHFEGLHQAGFPVLNPLAAAAHKTPAAVHRIVFRPLSALVSLAVRVFHGNRAQPKLIRVMLGVEIRNGISPGPVAAEGPSPQVYRAVKSVPHRYGSQKRGIDLQL